MHDYSGNNEHDQEAHHHLLGVEALRDTIVKLRKDVVFT